MASVELTNIDEEIYAALFGARPGKIAPSTKRPKCFFGSRWREPSASPRKATEAVLDIAGSWQDSRTAEEIIADIRSSRCSGDWSTGPDDVFA